MTRDGDWIRDREQSIIIIIISVVVAIIFIGIGASYVGETGGRSLLVSLVIAAAWTWFGIARCALFRSTS